MRSKNDEVPKAYRMLAARIVERALIDYRTALLLNSKSRIAEIEMFFYSSWFATLCDYNPDFLINRMKSSYGSDNEESPPQKGEKPAT